MDGWMDGWMDGLGEYIALLSVYLAVKNQTTVSQTKQTNMALVHSDCAYTTSRSSVYLDV